MRIRTRAESMSDSVTSLTYIHLRPSRDEALVKSQLIVSQ